MKTIYVLRHGKSDWGATYGSDHDRPLKERGAHAARLMGRFVASSGSQPGRVISSSAVRALTTARLAAEAGDWAAEVTVEPELYGAGPAGVLEIIQAVDDGIDSVLLAGHEPTCSAVVGGLIGSAEVRFPTAALACIAVSVARWEAVDFGRGALLWLVTPKLLASAGLDGA